MPKKVDRREIRVSLLVRPLDHDPPNIPLRNTYTNPAAQPTGTNFVLHFPFLGTSHQNRPAEFSHRRRFSAVLTTSHSRHPNQEKPRDFRHVDIAQSLKSNLLIDIVRISTQANTGRYTAIHTSRTKSSW